MTKELDNVTKTLGLAVQHVLEAAANADQKIHLHPEEINLVSQLARGILQDTVRITRRNWTDYSLTPFDPKER